MPRKTKTASAKSETPATNKSAFVRSHPNKSATELVELAKAQDIQLTTSHIYVVRTKVNKAKRIGAPAGKKRGPQAKASSASQPSRGGTGLSAQDRELLRLAAKVGFDRAKVLLSLMSEFAVVMR